MFLILLNFLSIGFYTVLERKLISFSQIRLGPNKTFVMGMIQPILDGLKLMKKSLIINSKVFVYIFNCSAMVVLFLSLMMWNSFPYLVWVNKSMTMMWVLLLTGLTTYCSFLVGWSSLSKFSFLGSMRSLAQTISLEVLISVILFMSFSLNSKFMVSYSFMHNNFVQVTLSFLFFMIVIMETHRAPADLSESESELVSGYNTELVGVVFIMVFLSEYMNMIFFTGMLMFFFMKLFIFYWGFILAFILLIRSCYPRIRYDHLMNVCWKKMFFILMYLMILLLPTKFL